MHLEEREYFNPRKLSSPANYEESNLSQQFHIDTRNKGQEQFDIQDEDSAAKAEEDDDLEADEMMRKAQTYAAAKDTPSSYSEADEKSEANNEDEDENDGNQNEDDDDDDEDEDMSDQLEEQEPF